MADEDDGPGDDDEGEGPPREVPPPRGAEKEDGDEHARPGAKRAECVRRAGGTGADVAQVDVSVDATDDVAARDRADEVSDEPDDEQSDRGGRRVDHSRAPRSSILIGVPWKS